MIKHFISLTLFFLLCNSASAQGIQLITDTTFYNGVSKWFNAWGLVSKEIYHIDKLRPVDFVFFDEHFVYSTSDIAVPGGDTVRGPKILGHQFNWKRVLQTDSITLPDMSRVPVGLMSFAADNTMGKPFFVMPLPSFWRKAGVDSKEFGLENLVTGVFVHEFSHSQQMQNFGRRITEMEKSSHFGIEFSDDIVQNLFDKDSVYTSLYRKEVNTFYAAVIEKDRVTKDSLIRAGLDILHTRHQKYFISTYKSLSETDEFFLTMEGLGQYSIYTWLINKKGANLPAIIVIEGVRRGRKWWSQDEGFVLFLLLSQFSEPKHWASQMFGDKTENIIDLIIRQLDKR